MGKAVWQNINSLSKRTSPQRDCMLLHIIEAHGIRRKIYLLGASQ